MPYPGYPVLTLEAATVRGRLSYAMQTEAATEGRGWVTAGRRRSARLGMLFN